MPARPWSWSRTGCASRSEGLAVFAGAPLPFDATDLSGRMRGGEVRIRLDLGAGAGVGEAFGCDLTEAYVVENSAYST